MVELVSFILGAGFSFLVYFLSIRPQDISGPRKAAYFLLSFIGITGTVFLFGVMLSFVLNGMK